MNGFIALTSMLIIGALVLTISIGVLLRSINEMKMSLGEQEAHRALALVNLCGELALMKIESVFNYSGNESIIIGEESCDVLQIEGSGNTDRTIKVQSTVSGYTKKVKIEISQISPAMYISSWEEVQDF